MDCQAEIDRLFVGSMYIFGFFSMCLLSLSKAYTLLEQNMTNRVTMLEFKLDQYKYLSKSNNCDSENSSSEEDDSSSSSEEEEESSSEEEEERHPGDDVVVSEYWAYSNTI